MHRLIIDNIVFISQLKNDPPCLKCFRVWIFPILQLVVMIQLSGHDIAPPPVLAIAFPLELLYMVANGFFLFHQATAEELTFKEALIGEDI